MNDYTQARTLAGRKRGFWARQFSSRVTRPQLIFDVVFGIVLPVLCFVFDPAVFRGLGEGFMLAPLAPHKLFVYLFSAVSMATLALWLTSRRGFGALGGVGAGVMLAGAVCSFVIGVLILPLTIFGLLFMIGVLGFTPFFTSLVYVRNAARAFKAATPHLRPSALLGAVALGASLAGGVTVVAHGEINRTIARSMDELLRQNAGPTEAAVRRLRYFGWFADLDELVWAYARETDPARKARLAGAYKEITGSEMEKRLAILAD